MPNEINAAVFYISKQDNDLYYLREFISLARNAGYKVVETFHQNLEKPSPHTYFGPGKIVEIKQIIENRAQKTNENDSIKYILINDDITPLQKKMMEDILGLPVVDRTSIILEIFDSNAKSKEAKLQVEIAKLKYASNQLVNALASYSQVTSGKGKKQGRRRKGN